jgi:hypothetical protein
MKTKRQQIREIKESLICDIKDLIGQSEHITLSHMDSIHIKCGDEKVIQLSHEFCIAEGWNYRYSDLNIEELLEIYEYVKNGE